MILLVSLVDQEGPVAIWVQWLFKLLIIHFVVEVKVVVEVDSFFNVCRFESTGCIR